ncbi:uncharacterized protein [Epargyreus clarus]|uniref:uncharacterized protein isoform X2 n=1 Tax=Epargyreus clarus TaxID=520877 RepID=UPI003C30328A
MPEIPECLNRRYKALDELVKDLNSISDLDTTGECCNDPGVRLMCQFWNILKENPDCNLKKVVQQRVGQSTNSGMFRPQKVSCYMAAHNCMKKDDDDMKKLGPGSKIKNMCCHTNQEPTPKPTCCASRSVTSSHASDDVLPLSKVLCNLKEAASFDRRCQGMVNDLMVAQKKLQDQIQHLEHREKEGIQLLKQADCMWSCMEDAYKKKILESQERQQELLKQLKEADANTGRWRKNKKDLEFQLENINMCHQEILEKLNQKQNDIKCMNRDIQDYKKRIENQKKEVEAAKKSLSSKKQASDDKIKKISADISKKEALIKEEKNRKVDKENEGHQYIKEARADLLNLTRVLMQKKIENEDMKTQKEALIEEFDLVAKTYDTCKDRCKTKKQSIEDEIKIIDKEIANYKVKCLRCHQCTDTIDIRKFCTDCPRCLEERECLYKEDHCSHDHTMDCVCMGVKQKFLDNVFENMYTVLERQIKTGPGKAVAETILNCLKRSRNGKLDEETRQILQDFILTTVKKNLNLTIVGGAVKTRCELDPETYKQLMLCLKQVKAFKPPTVDKETPAKKPPCRRWGGESECNCPKGPTACICIKKAPPPPDEPSPCPPPDKEDLGEQKVCPYKESASCGPDCAMHAVPSAVGTDVAAWRPDPCKGQTCHFKNMRAAQCVLGPEALNNISNSRSYVTAVPYVPNINMLDDQIPCKCETSPTQDCTCKKDAKQIKADPRTKCNNEICRMLDNLESIQGYKGNQLGPSEKVIVDSKIKEDLIKEQFQPLLYEKSTEIDRNIFANDYQNHTKEEESKPSELIAKQSPNVDIDNQVIDLIEVITKEDPNTFVMLKKTKSGNLSLNINSVNENNGDNILIKKSPSGNMLIEVDENTIQTLKSKKNNKHVDSKSKSPTNKTKEIIGPEIPGSSKPLCSKIDKCTQNNVKKMLLRNSKENFSACTPKCLKLTKDLLKMYKNGQRNIEVNIKYQKKELNNKQATITQVPPENNVGIHVKNPGIAATSRVEFPVSIHRTNSSTINICFDHDENLANSVATRTESNGFIFNLKHQLQSAKPRTQSVSKKEELIKIKLKGLDNAITEPPALMKETLSGNYDIVLEKEFEKAYTQTIRHQMGEESESFFEITKTSSSIILDFDKNDRVRSESKKALLMKSQSGLLKVIVSDSTSSVKEEVAHKKRSLASGSMISAKTLIDLLRKLPSSSTFHKRNKTQPKKTKSNSDSHLYERAKLKLRSRQSLLEKSSTTLQKTPSGQYAVFLDKKSKISFINNLISYIDKSSKGVIPIKRTESGEITINFNKNVESVSEYGSMKVTSSGNIYVILDEKAIKRISNNVAVNTSSKRGETTPYISKIINPDNKAIATTCNAQPDDDLCDASKCVCEKLDTQDYFINSRRSISPTESHFCGKSKCLGVSDKQSIKSYKSPHIVIRPSESRPVPDRRNKFEQTYYCKVQSICPYHKDRYEAVSNELLEISGLCSKSQEKKLLTKIKTQSKKKPVKLKNSKKPSWNSFDYLPPQLPYFLRNITYKLQ